MKLNNRNRKTSAPAKIVIKTFSRWTITISMCSTAYHNLDRQKLCNNHISTNSTSISPRGSEVIRRIGWDILRAGRLI